jgi:DNA modification methylase
MSTIRQQSEIFEPGSAPDKGSRSAKQNRANDLGGKEWLQNSISIWSDIRRTVEEQRLGHPAMFPVSLVLRILRTFTTAKQTMALDPFLGSGTTLIAAMSLEKSGIGFDVSKEYVKLAQARLASQGELFLSKNLNLQVINDDALNLLQYTKEESIDICVTSPPYWNILQQKRSADYKQVKDYDEKEGNLGNIESYQMYLRELCRVFEGVYISLKKSSYCIVNVMDIRKGARFYPLHSDLAQQMESLGFTFDDLIIWDRRHEYNNLRPLGYPSVFRINRAHEYLLIFQKRK